ncbi:MAG: outer membrane beta-barrel protein [Bacteroidota bacterium]
MKKFTILPLVAILFSFSSLNAQITKGSLFLGGNINVSLSHPKADDNSENYNADNFNFSPTIGKVIKDNLVFGAGLTYAYTKYSYGPANNISSQKVNSYGANIFLRRYSTIGKGFSIYLEGSLGGNYSKSDNTPNLNSNNFKRTSFGLGATPGISYTITKKLQLETGLSQVFGIAYSHEKGDKGGYNNDSPYKNNSFNLYTSLNSNFLSSVYFGFRFLL